MDQLQDTTSQVCITLSQMFRHSLPDSATWFLICYLIFFTGSGSERFQMSSGEKREKKKKGFFP